MQPESFWQCCFYLLYSSGFSGKAQYPVRMEDSAFDWSSCMDTDAAYRWHVAEERIFMMTAFEEICFWLMAAMPWIMLACLFTDRERPTSKRYWWYLPPSILSLLTAIAVGIPQIVDKRISGFGCWCTLIFTFVCAYHDEMEGLENLHGKLICLSVICTAFAMICWCVGY